MKIVIINGPNLNLLGVREKSIYGSEAFAGFLDKLRAAYPDDEMTFFQSNHEGAIIDELHRVGFSCDGVVLNAGAYTHTSIALHDALELFKGIIVEVHLSNILEREDYRKTDYIKPLAKICFMGKKENSYYEALSYLQNT